MIRLLDKIVFLFSVITLCGLLGAYTARFVNPDIFVIPSLLTAQVLNVFHTGCLHGHKSIGLISIFDQLYYIIPNLHLTGKHVLHSRDRFLL